MVCNILLGFFQARVSQSLAAFDQTLFDEMAGDAVVGCGSGFESCGYSVSLAAPCSDGSCEPFLRWLDEPGDHVAGARRQKWTGLHCGPSGTCGHSHTMPDSVSLDC